MAAAGSGLQSQLGCQFSIAGLNKKRAIGKGNRRDNPLAVVCLDDKLLGIFIFLNIYSVIWDLVLSQKLLALPAVGAPVGTIHGYFWL
jgi:hypothetical protein